MRRFPEFMRARRGQAALETAFLLPMLLVMAGGVFELGRMMYVYNQLEKSVKSGVQFLQHTQGVNYCADDPAFTDAKNMIVFGNLQGTGQPVVTGLTVDMVTFFAERSDSAMGIQACPCGTDPGTCDTSQGGTPPDYVVANLGPGFPLDMRFPLGVFGTTNLQVSVRLPFLGE